VGKAGSGKPGSEKADERPSRAGAGASGGAQARAARLASGEDENDAPVTADAGISARQAVVIEPGAHTGATSEDSPVRDARVGAEQGTPPPAGLSPLAEAPREEETPAKDVDLASLDFASQCRLWESFVTHVRQRKVTLGVCLISSTLESIDGDFVRLRFAKGCSFQKEQVDEAANKKFLRSMTKKYFGRDMEVVCVSADEERETRRKPKAPAAEPTKANSGIDESPLFRKIIDDFDGEIIRYRPK
jgi:hypothetical protein